MSWGQTTTYTFSSNAWAASPANWVSGQNGFGFVSGRGIQITTGASGAFGNSPISFSNMSQVKVNYSTNASAGAGTIRPFAVSGTSAAAQSGTAIAAAQSVTTIGGTTLRSLTFTPGSSLSGFLQIYVTCTTNSIYIHSVEVTFSTAAAPILAITPSTTNHGSSCVGVPASSIAYTVTNTGTVAATGITVVSSGTNNADFVVSGLSSTTIAASGGTATYNVTFTPSGTGSRAATITVASGTSGSNSPTINLTGTGINAGPTVTSPTSTSITISSATLGGNITDLGCSAVTTRGIEYSTTNNFVNGTGTVASETAVSYPTGTFTFPVIGLNGGTTYYYKAFATSSGGTVYSVQSSFTTLLAEPTNHPTNFAAGSVGITSIPQTWAASVAGVQAPSGYLIKASTTTVVDPVDGTDPTNVTAFSAGIANRKVTPGTATTGASFTGMSSGTMYNYKIYPYTGTGTGINFKIADAPGFNHATLPTAPTALSNSNLQATTASLSWTLGTHNAGNKILVFVKQGSAVTTGTPTAAPITYTANSTFGSGTAFQNDAAAYCVYQGDGTSVNLTGLLSNTTYHIAIYRVVETSNSNGTNSYSSVLTGTVTTLVNPVSVPYTQNFEGTTNEWVLDASGTNIWAIGSATNNGGTKALYISNDNGVSNAYTLTSSQVPGTNASLRVDLTGLTNASLSFDWKSNGESTFDYGEVYINAGTSDVLLSTAQEFFNTTAFATKTIDLTNYVGQIVTLKFRWRNDASLGNEPPFAVDNVSVVPYSLPNFTTAAITDITYNSATSGGTITNDGGTAITARGIVFATSPSPTLDSNVVNSGSGTGTYMSNLTGLLSSTTYYVRAFVTNTNGTTYGNQISFTTSLLEAPTASAASDLTSASFTANWSSVIGATSYVLDVYEVSPGSNATDLFISEYVEGSSNNKYIEIFNGTGATVDLSDYSLANYNAGSAPPSSTLTLSGQLANNTSYVVRNDQAIVWGGTSDLSTSSQVMGFNGNDVIALRYLGTDIDVVGVIGVDSNFAMDITLTRNSNVYSPTTSYNAADFTSSGVNTVSELGSHAFDGGSTLTYFLQNENVGNITSFTVTGLNPETEYFYVVRASDGQESANSNEIAVTTSAASTSTTWIITPPALVADWTNGAPTALIDAIIADDYNETEAITAKNLTINMDIVLTVQAANTLSVAGNLINNGSIVFESDENGTSSFSPYSGAAISGTGTTTVERYIPALRAWRLLAAPLTGTTGNKISDNWQGTDDEGLLLFSPNAAMMGYVLGGTSPNIRKYNGGFQFIDNLSTEAMFGASATDTKAFLVFPTGPSNSNNIVSDAAVTTLRPTGQLITGTVNHSGLAVDTYHLLANPYASAIDPASLLANINNAEQKFWLIDPSLGNFGAYATFDGTDWTPEEPLGADALIQSGQGFFVRSATATSFQITESDKVSGSSDNWFAKNATTTTTADKIRVLLYKQSAGNWKLADGILTVNYTEGSNAVNTKDSNKISNFNESIMFRNSTTNLSIEHRALPLATDIQPLRLTGTTALPYQLRVRTENYTNSTLLPVLEDTAAGTFTAIPTDGSDVVIPFTGVVSTSTNPDNRFRIVYQVNLSTVDQSPLVASVFPNPVTNNQLNVNLGTNTSSADYTITNLLGQFIQKGQLANTQNVITLSSVSQGFYILNITQEGKSFTTKIYVQ